MSTDHAGLGNPGKPSQVQWLGTVFAETDWLKTRAGAMKRVAAAIKDIDTEIAGFTWVIVERPARVKGTNDYEYLPVALLRDNQRWLSMYLIHKGIAVWG